jgi:hypothetical protein
MSSASYGLVLIFLGVGGTLGWYANRAIASHGDIKSTKKRISGYRKSRQHNGVITITIAVVIIIVVFDLIRPHS